MRYLTSFLILGFLSLLLFLGLMVLTYYSDLDTATLVGFLVYAFLGYFLIKWYSKRVPKVWLLFSLLFGVLITLLSYFSIGKSVRYIIPIILTHSLGILVAYLYLRNNRRVFLIFTFFSVVIVGFMFLSGYSLYKHKLIFGTFTGLVSEPIDHFTFYDSEGNEFTPIQCRNKIVILDFWNTGCGVCIKKFPNLQKIYHSRKDDKSVLVFAVNVPLPRDSFGNAMNVLKRNNLTVPLLLDKHHCSDSVFKISGVPYVVAIRDGDEIIYRGDIDGVSRIFDN